MCVGIGSQCCASSALAPDFHRLEAKSSLYKVSIQSESVNVIVSKFNAEKYCGKDGFVSSGVRISRFSAADRPTDVRRDRFSWGT